MKQGLPRKDDSGSGSQETPVFCGIRRFITVFTKILHWTLLLAS